MRKSAAWVLVSTLAALLVGCDAGDVVGPAAPPDIVDAIGVVRAFDSSHATFIDTDAPDGRRFVPTNLPRAYRVEGLRVLFSARSLAISPNVRLMGAPIELTRIDPAR